MSLICSIISDVLFGSSRCFVVLEPPTGRWSSRSTGLRIPSVWKMTYGHVVKLSFLNDNFYVGNSCLVNKTFSYTPYQLRSLSGPAPVLNQSASHRYTVTKPLILCHRVSNFPKHWTANHILIQTLVLLDPFYIVLCWPSGQLNYYNSTGRKPTRIHSCFNLLADFSGTRLLVLLSEMVHNEE